MDELRKEERKEGKRQGRTKGLRISGKPRVFDPAAIQALGIEVLPVVRSLAVLHSRRES